MKKLRIIACLMFLILSVAAPAQFFGEASHLDSISDTPITRKIGLRFQSFAFFKNNEYFHPLIEGYTLPGFQLQPRLYYALDDKFSLEAGIHLSQFSGKKGLNSVDPLFRATYSPTRNFSILLGWLKGTYNHQLLEPLYQWERMYTRPLEYGVQFLVDKPGFKLDTWIDWEKYIELNDPFQEELTFGTTSKILLLKQENLELWFPVQTTIKHMGGQVITVDEPLKTLVNYASGLNVSLYRPESLLKQIDLNFAFFGYNDFSPQKKQPFSNGYGIYPAIAAHVKAFRASVGYWYGHRFISPMGEPLFQSVSVTNPAVTYNQRQVLTIKTSFYKPIYKEVSFAAYFESYYDFKIKQMDYAYGISISISGDLLLKQLF